MEAGSTTKLLADFVQKDQWRGHWERAEGDIPCVQQIQWNNEDRITAEELKLVLAHLLGKVENIKIFHFFTFALSGRLQTRKLMRWHGCIFLRKPKQGGGGILRIRMRKVKDLVNNASILAIFLLKLCNFSQNFLLIMQFFAYWLCFSSFTENFPYFFCKISSFWAKFLRKFKNFENNA